MGKDGLCGQGVAIQPFKKIIDALCEAEDEWVVTEIKDSLVPVAKQDVTILEGLNALGIAGAWWHAVELAEEIVSRAADCNETGNSGTIKVKALQEEG